MRDQCYNYMFAAIVYILWHTRAVNGQYQQSLRERAEMSTTRLWSSISADNNLKYKKSPYQSMVKLENVPGKANYHKTHLTEWVLLQPWRMAGVLQSVSICSGATTYTG